MANPKPTLSTRTMTTFNVTGAMIRWRSITSHTFFSALASDEKDLLSLEAILIVERSAAHINLQCR